MATTVDRPADPELCDPLLHATRLSSEYALLFFNDRFDEARTLTTRQANGDFLFGEHKCSAARVAHHRAELEWIVATANDVEEEMEAAMQSIRTAKDLAGRQRDILGIQPGGWFSSSVPTTDEELFTVDGLILEADLTIMEALVLMKGTSYVKGGYLVRKGWKLYEEAQTLAERMGLLDDDRADSLSEIAFALRNHLLLGLGMFHFIASMIPSMFKWLAELIGFSANREAGLAELEACARAPDGLRAPTAAIFLTFFNVFIMDQTDLAEDILNALAETCSGSFVQFARGYLTRKVGRLDEASAAFLHVTTHAPIMQIQLNACRELGRTYLGVPNFEPCLPLFERFIAESTNKMWEAYCHWQWAVALESLGRYPEARDALRPLLDMEVEDKREFGKFAVFRAKQLLGRGDDPPDDAPTMRPIELAYAQAYFMRDCGQFQVAVDTLATAKEIAGEDLCADDAGLFHYMTGSNLREIDPADAAAEEHLRAAMALADDLEDETFVVPWAMYDLAEMCTKQGRFDEADALVGEAKAITGFSFERMLDYKLKKNKIATKEARAAAANN